MFNPAQKDRNLIICTILLWNNNVILSKTIFIPAFSSDFLRTFCGHSADIVRKTTYKILKSIANSSLKQQGWYV